MRWMIAGIGIAFCLGGAATADTLADSVLAAARQSCEEAGGQFDAGKAVTATDLTGDGTPDTLIDEGAFACAGTVPLFCGSGGCMLHAIVGDTDTIWQAEGWRVVDWDSDRILLIARDGGWCGGAGAEGCYEAVVWRNGRFLSVMPASEGLAAPDAPAQGGAEGNPTAPYSTDDYDATTLLPCSLDFPTQDLQCPAGILRHGAPGDATIRVMAPDGVERVLDFAGGNITSPGPGDVTWAKDGDDWYIGIGSREYYIVPDAAVFGG